MSISARDAATIPEVGLTSLFSLKRTAVLPGQGPLPGPGSPWNKTNLTVRGSPAVCKQAMRSCGHSIAVCRTLVALEPVEPLPLLGINK